MFHTLLATAACVLTARALATLSEFSTSSLPAHTLQLYRDADGTCTVGRVGVGVNRELSDAQPVFVERTGRLHAQDDDAERLRVYSHDEQLLWDAARLECRNAIALVPYDFKINPQRPLAPMHMETVPEPELRISPILVSGPSGNRVNLVFFSDGYVEDEYDKFVDDATKLAWDIAGNTTFATVRPLLNIFAAFTPSNESGIGIGGKPKDTAFGLYRDGTELRGVYTSRRDVARAACEVAAKTVGCDYPILLGNDPRYGGLGGEFTIVTASKLNGPLVLRHELGHSVIEVGEEYDGGFAYCGVNAANLSSSTEETFKWEHWLTAPPARAERAVMPLQDYAWAMLNHSTPFISTFTSAGTYASHVVVISLSGIPSASHLRVSLDGKDLGWTPREAIGEDRWHYRLHVDEGLKEGEHEVKFELLEDGAEGDPETGEGAQLCSVEVIEYGTEEEFNTTEGHISAYPTFSIDNTTTYRPTNEGCLMRLVTTEGFCSVCIEGLWHSLLRHVDLIDNIFAVLPSCTSPLQLEIELVKLAQFRENKTGHNEAYAIAWTRDGEPLEQFANMTKIEVDPAQAAGTYTFDVQFFTDEVRKDPNGLLQSHRSFMVQTMCG